MKMKARAVLALAVAFAARVTAAWAGAPQDGPDRVVVVGVRGSDQDRAALRLVLDELLARIDLDPVVTAGAPEGADVKHGAFATVLLDVTGRTSASVAVQDGRSGHVRLLRQIEHAGSRPLLLDTAAHVIYAMLETMVRETGTRGAPAPAANAHDSPAGRSAQNPLLAQARGALPSGARPARWGIELSPFYGVRSFALPDQRPMMNAGLAISAGSRAGQLQPSLCLNATYGLDVAVGSGAGGMPGQDFGRVQVISLHATPIVNLMGIGRLLLQAGAGAGLDIIRLDASPAPLMGPPGPMGPGNVTPAPVRTRHFDPLVGALLVARLAITSATQLFLAAATDYGPSYPIQMGFGSVGPLQMPHWRYQGSLGLSVTLGGRPPARAPQALAP